MSYRRWNDVVCLLGKNICHGTSKPLIIFEKVPSSLFGSAVNMSLEYHKRRSSHQRYAVRKGVLRNFAKFTGKHLRQSLYFNRVAGHACNFIKIETLAQVLCCEFCKISKNTFFIEHVWASASLSSCFWVNIEENGDSVFMKTGFSDICNNFFNNYHFQVINFVVSNQLYHASYTYKFFVKKCFWSSVWKIPFSFSSIYLLSVYYSIRGINEKYRFKTFLSNVPILYPLKALGLLAKIGVMNE